MQVILFSKDRPLQLHATLTSFERHCVDHEIASVAILYFASSQGFRRGYQHLQRCRFRFAALHWIEEHRFKDDLLRLLYGSCATTNWPCLLLRNWFKSPDPLRSRHLLFLVDDTLFVRPFSLQQMAAALAANRKALAFSLRLGRNTTSCYSRNREQRLPVFSRVDANRLCFRWPGEEGDFGYPLEISSSLYRTSDLITLLTILPYRNPNRLEQALAISSKLYAIWRNELLCFDQSVAFCAPINKVQSIIDNRASDLQAYASESLNALFLQGVRIDVSQLDGFVSHAAHQEIQLPLSLSSGPS